MFHVWSFLNDCHELAAGYCSLLQLKPILTMKNGIPDSVKVRTSKKAFERMAEMLRDYSPIERFALVHTNAAQKAEFFKNQITRFLPDEKILSMDITPVIGAHLGPGAVGFAIVSKGKIA